LAGGAAAGLLGVGAIALCEALGWWWIPFAPTPYFLMLFYVGLAISLTPIYPVTWRLARRFGWRGLAAQHLQIGLEKMYVHALHTVHALPDVRVAAGRLRDGVSDYFP
jgi:hypothetical protein